MQRLCILFAVLVLGTISCKKDEDLPPVIPPVIVADLVIPSDSVKIDPYGYTPLAALVSFSSTVEGKTAIKVVGKHGAATDIQHTFNDNGLTHSIPVIGLYPDYLNTVDISLINNNGDTVAKKTITIQTASLPPNLPTSIESDIFPNSSVESGLNL